MFVPKYRTYPSLAKTKMRHYMFSLTWVLLGTPYINICLVVADVWDVSRTPSVDSLLGAIPPAVTPPHPSPTPPLPLNDQEKERIIFLHYCYERIAASRRDHRWIDSEAYREQVIKEATEAVAYWKTFGVLPRMGQLPPRPSNDWNAP